MKKIKSKNSKSFVTLLKLTIFIYYCIQQILGFITCPKEFLYQIGINTTCESDSDVSIPCDGSHNLHVMKAYINCVEGYFNDKPDQMITCNSTTGTWTPQPLRCFRHCHRSPISKNIELLNNKTQYPWYAEILKNRRGNLAEKIIPALIMTGRMIMTWEKYFSPDLYWNLTNYVVRIYEPPNSFEDFNIERIEYISSEPVIYNYQRSSEHERFCILILTNEKYIKINSEDTRPPCLEEEIFANSSWYLEVSRAIPEYNLPPKYPNQCYVPNLSNRKNIELMCYQSSKFKPLERCPDKVPALQTKCKLGYEKINSAKTDFLSMCIANRWNINDKENENCELICGEINETEDKKSAIKIPTWHVAIYSTETKEILSPHNQICSGIIIHKDIILSAAQCFYDKKEEKLKDPADFFIEAGKNFQKANNSMKNDEQYVNISKIHIPPTYGKGNWVDNIAVVIAVSPFTFNLHVNPICINLDSKSGLENGKSGKIFKWKAVFDSSKSTGVNPGNYCNLKQKLPSFCRNDIGGGFFVKEIIDSKMRYILKGIISSNIGEGFYSSNNSAITVTDLQYVQEFVKMKVTEHRQKFNYKDVRKLIWHRIYAHRIWAAPYWIRKEFNLKLQTVDPNL